MMNPPTIDQQIDEVERELRMRELVYPKFVAGKKLRQGEADEHMRRMRAVHATLIEIRNREDEEQEPWTR
jgi:hypothetical protein